MGIKDWLLYRLQRTTGNQRMGAAVAVLGIFAVGIAAKGDTDVLGDLNRVDSGPVQDGSRKSLKEQLLRVPMSDGRRDAAVSLSRRSNNCVVSVRVPKTKNVEQKHGSLRSSERDREDNDATAVVTAAAEGVKVTGVRDGQPITSVPYGVRLKTESDGVSAQIYWEGAATEWVQCSGAVAETAAPKSGAARLRGSTPSNVAVALGR